MVLINALLIKWFVIILHVVTIEVVGSIATALSKRTTIGNSEKFGDWVDTKLESIKSERIKTAIKNLTYSKIFVCRSCHTFWITFAILSIGMPTIGMAIIGGLYARLLCIRHEMKKELDDAEKK